jgi:hypothetical protein
MHLAMDEWDVNHVAEVVVAEAKISVPSATPNRRDLGIVQ